jgi:hypothetical protein
MFCSSRIGWGVEAVDGYPDPCGEWKLLALCGGAIDVCGLYKRVYELPPLIIGEPTGEKPNCCCIGPAE